MWVALKNSRVHTDQVIKNICACLQSKKHMIEAQDRAKFKFPGHQKIYISKWAFIKFNSNELEGMISEKQPISDDCTLDKQQALHSRELQLCCSVL